MKIVNLHRYLTTGKAVYGCLEWENDKCYTLEHPPRDQKIKGQTGVPAGAYYLTYRYSPSRSRKMPYLDNVPNFRNVMLHSGNTLKDTTGCILVGDTIDTAYNKILFSRRAFGRFIKWFAPQWEQGEEILLNIYNDYQK
jgi:hypothetical protein